MKKNKDGARKIISNQLEWIRKTSGHSSSLCIPRNNFKGTFDKFCSVLREESEELIEIALNRIIEFGDLWEKKKLAIY